jgi:O-antigen/teichoic acid export membrane protein
LSNVVLFLFFLLLNHWVFHFGLTTIIVVNILVNFISGLLCTAKRWDGLLYMGHARKSTEKDLVNFGKYSMGTLISSSLLKSADTFIIGLSPFLGSAGIAMYAIPLKLTDLLGIPLHSFSMTAYPRMSKKCLEGDIAGALNLFYTYAGAVTVMFLPAALVSFVFAEELILLLGGTAYAESLPLLATIFRVFALYVLLLPVDRFTGVLLDSLDRPRYNLYKVMAMTTANILVDLVAVFVFQSLVAVAVGTVLFTLLGIVLGLYFLRREVDVRLRHMVFESLYFFKNLKSHWAP